MMMHLIASLARANLHMAILIVSDHEADVYPVIKAGINLCAR
jgi:hypothetical protein